MEKNNFNKYYLNILFCIVLLISIFSGKESYDSPDKYIKIDVKSYRVFDGRKYPRESFFSKYEYVFNKKTEKVINFKEYQTKPLTVKGELELFWTESLKDYWSTQQEYVGSPRCESSPDGWIVNYREIYYVLDVNNGTKRNTFGYPMLFDTNNDLCIGRYKSDNNLSCWNWITGEIIWNRPINNPIPEIHSGDLYINRQF